MMITSASASPVHHHNSQTHDDKKSCTFMRARCMRARVHQHGDEMALPPTRRTCNWLGGRRGRTQALGRRQRGLWPRLRLVLGLRLLVSFISPTIILLVVLAVFVRSHSPVVVIIDDIIGGLWSGPLQASQPVRRACGARLCKRTMTLNGNTVRATGNSGATNPLHRLGNLPSFEKTGSHGSSKFASSHLISYFLCYIASNLGISGKRLADYNATEE